MVLTDEDIHKEWNMLDIFMYIKSPLLDGEAFDDDKKAICFLEFAPTVCPGLMNVSPEQGGHCPVRGPARRHLHVSALCTCSCPALRTRLHPAQIAGKVSRLLWLAASHVCVA